MQNSPTKHMIVLAIIIIIAKPLSKSIKLWKSLCLESCPHIGLAKKFEIF